MTLVEKELLPAPRFLPLRAETKEVPEDTNHGDGT